MSGEVYLRDLTSEQQNSKKTLQWWRAVGDTMFYKVFTPLLLQEYRPKYIKLVSFYTVVVGLLLFLFVLHYFSFVLFMFYIFAVAKSFFVCVHLKLLS